MTQPDQYFPVTAINASPGFAAYSRTTEGDYEEAMWNAAANPFQSISGLCALFEQLPFFGGLAQYGTGSGQGRTGDTMNGVQIFSDGLCGLATGSPSPGTTPQTVVSGVQVATDTSVTMLSGVPFVGATATDLVSAGQDAVQDNTANHVANQSLTTAQSVALKQENLLISQDFAQAYNVSVDPDNNWVWNGDDGAVTMGCLEATANGALLEYVSNEVPVVVGETIEVSAYVRTVGLVYTGTSPVSVGVQKYRKGRAADRRVTYLDVGGYEVLTFEPSVGSATPAGRALPTGLPFALAAEPTDDSGWVGVAGTYVVQAGVDQLRFKFTVHSEATSGTVRFDEANFLKLDLIGDDCVPGVGATTDSIVTQLYGVAGEGFTHNQAAVALANTRATINSTAAKVAALEAEQIATGGGGSIAGDDFNWTGYLDTPNWLKDSTAGGWYYADGSDAVFTDYPYANTYVSYLWNGTDAVSTTDYQIVQLVMTSGLATDSVSTSSITLFGRARTNWASYVYATVDCYGGWAVGNEAEVLRTGTTAIPGAGTTLTLYCGEKATDTLQRFKFMVNASTITNFTQAAASTVGENNRRYGFGAYSGGGYNYFVIPTQMNPPSIGQWLGLDQ